EDMPATSHFHFDIILSIEGLSEAKSPSWLSNNFQTYILLHPDADPKAVEDKLMKLVMDHIAPQIAQVFGDDFTIDKFKESGNKIEYTLQPLSDIHLKSDLFGEFEPNFNMAYVYLFSAVALFILAIACINFMNLSNDRTANHAIEISVRNARGN